MFRILKTIEKILNKKKKSESCDYLRGYSDCFELMKIGLEKSNYINFKVENIKLKRILYRYLHFEFELSQSQLKKIKDLLYLQNEEYRIIDSLFNQILSNPQKDSSQLINDEFEIKLQNFNLKEILYKLINHKFNLSKYQVKFINDIAESYLTHNEKIQKIISFLTSLEIENQWPDYHNIVLEKKELLSQIDKLNEIVDEKNDLQEDNKVLRHQNIKMNKLQVENSILHEIINSFLCCTVYKYDKYEISEIYYRNFPMNQKLKLISRFLDKLKLSNVNEFFKVSENERLEIAKIINNNKSKDDCIQEVCNYINYIIARDELKVTRRIREKIKNL
ncbi:MAG: hypothetical protein K9J13_13350 [Saprospiraceae bacterium]|nr:hypothetical protein [Saprospiraceae bacterium]